MERDALPRRHPARGAGSTIWTSSCAGRAVGAFFGRSRRTASTTPALVRQPASPTGASCRPSPVARRRSPHGRVPVRRWSVRRRSDRSPRAGSATGDVPPRRVGRRRRPREEGQSDGRPSLPERVKNREFFWSVRLLSQMILQLSCLLVILPFQTCTVTMPYWYWYTTSEEIAVYDTVLKRECPVSNISATKKFQPQ